MIRLVNGLAVLVLALGLMTTAAQATDVLLTKENYDGLMVGNTVIGVTGGQYWKAFYMADGKRVFVMETGFKDEGKHWFKDNGEICSVWQVIHKKKESCTKYWIDGDSYRYTSNSGVERDDKLVKGTHEGWNHADWK